jgi:hypothetical protein
VRRDAAGNWNIYRGSCRTLTKEQEITNICRFTCLQANSCSTQANILREQPRPCEEFCTSGGCCLRHCSELE